MTTVADVDLSGWVRQSASPIFDGVHTNTVRSGVRQNLIFEDLFDDGLEIAEDPWRVSGNSPTVDHVNKWMVVALDRDVDATPFRTSAVVTGLPEPYFMNTGLHANIGDTYWYGHSIYLPPDYVIESTAREIITQWHGRPDIENDPPEDYRNPPLSLHMRDGNYTLSIVADSKAITVNKNYTRQSDVIVLGALAPTIGKWTNWVFKVKWSYLNDGSGTVEVYQDGVLIYDDSNILDNPSGDTSNCFNDALGPYWVPGLYKWEWKVGEPATDTTTRLYYFDNVRIGNENATLTDVWEDHT